MAVHPQGVLRSIPARDLMPTDLDAGDVLLALGREDCPACVVLGASIGVLARAYPACAVVSVRFAEPVDWAVRDPLLWPRGISVSRAVMPTLALLQSGDLTWQRHGALPAHALIDALRPYLGDPTQDIAGPDDAEDAARMGVAARRAQLIRARSSGF